MKEVVPSANLAGHEVLDAERGAFDKRLDEIFDPANRETVVNVHNLARLIDLPPDADNPSAKKKLAIWYTMRDGDKSGYCMEVTDASPSGLDYEGMAIISDNPEVVKRVAREIYDTRALGDPNKILELEGGGWKDYLAQAA